MQPSARIALRSTRRIHSPRVESPVRLLASCACALLAQLASTVAVADSATGVDTVFGSALSPGRPALPVPYDRDAYSGKHSPSGRLVGMPPTLPSGRRTTSGGWEYNATIEAGVLAGDADDRAALFRMYKDLDNGIYVTDFALQMEQPDGARFLEADGGAAGRDDQFYALQFGRYNDWRARIFYSEIPHVFTTTYRSLWEGVGSGELALRATTPPLVPGGGNAAPQAVAQNLRTALASIPDSELQLVRTKGGVRYDLTVSPAWKLYANYTQEKREGSRPFGAVFGGGGGGGNIEIPESIDYTTHELAAGARYRDSRQSANLQLSASLFRNDIDTLRFENPLTIALNGIAGLSSSVFTSGRYDLAPDNEYYQLRGEYARSFPGLYESRFTAVASASTSRQNDRLVEPTLLSLAGGSSIATGLALGERWNTTAALSRQNADARIDLRLVDLGWSARPSERLSITGKVRYYETTNEMQYWSCNPLTGEWGRILNDGSGSVVVGTNTTAGNNPPGTSLAAYSTAGCSLDAARGLGLVPNSGLSPIASIPFDYRQMNYRLSGDYRIGRDANVLGTYERETFHRDQRERDRTWEDKYRVEYSHRALPAGASLRASYEHARRRGSAYDSNPYDAFYSASLGPLPTADGTNVATWIRTISGLRKFDLADRTNNVLNGMVTLALGPGLDAGLQAQWKDSDYPGSEFGRIDHERRGSAGIDVNYQPQAAWSVYAFYAYQTARMKQAGIQMNTCVLGVAGVTTADFETACGAAGGPLFPLENAWQVDSRDRNNVAGLGFRYDFGKALLDLNHTYSNGRTRIGYGHGDGIVLSPAQRALAGSGFSDLTFIQNTLEASLLVPISKTLAARVYYRYENGRIRDWHYDGVAENPVPANAAVYLDSGAQDYRVNLIGIFLRVTL